MVLPKDILPQPEHEQPASARRILEAEQIKVRIARLEETKRFPISKLWRDHFQSVWEFRAHLARNGGVHKIFLRKPHPATIALVGLVGTMSMTYAAAPSGTALIIQALLFLEVFRRISGKRPPKT